MMNLDLIKTKRATAYSLKYLVVTFFSLLALYPFLWVLMTSFKNNFELYNNPFGIPRSFAIQNHFDAWQIANISTNFFNSIIITTVVVAAVLLIAAMAAYVLARVWTSRFMYTFIIIGIMIPYHALIIPIFILIKELGLMNTRVGLTIVYIAINLSLGIFLLVGFMKSIPREIEEAAYIDGASRTRTFFNVIFPLSKPGLATVGTLTLLNSWNEFLFANVLISRTTAKTLTQGIAAMQGEYFTNYGMLCAGLLTSIVPVTILYIVFQEQVIKGMAAGAIKG